MKASLAALIVALAFLAMGLATRLTRLGWSVSGDHTTTFKEVASLTDKPFFLDDLGKMDVTARTVPVGYGLQAAAFRVFGVDEAGSRRGSAIAGGLAIAVCVFLTARLYGLPHAAVVGSMLLLWTWQLGHSQNNRPPYSYGFLFTSVAMLAAAISWRRNSAAWGVFAGVMSAVAISTNSLSAVVPAGLGLFLVVELAARRGPVKGRSLLGYLLAGAPLMAAAAALAVWAFGAYVDKAAAAGWGRSPERAVVELAFNVGWGVVLLSIGGWLVAWVSDDATDRMWASIAVVILAACVAVPYKTAFRADYVFPACLVFFLLAARQVMRACSALAQRSRIGAVALAAAVVLLPMPSFVSYYRDGDRKDYRAAAAFIKANMKPGDLVGGDTVEALGYYLPGVKMHPVGRTAGGAAARTIATLTDLTADGGRVWYVCRLSREEPAAQVDRWLWSHAVRMLRVKAERYDYHENILDVYLFNPTAEDRSKIDAEAPRKAATSRPVEEDRD